MEMTVSVKLPKSLNPAIATILPSVEYVDEKCRKEDVFSIEGVGLIRLPV